MNLKFLRKTSWVLVLMLFTYTAVFAQQKQITGKVVDKKDGQPVPGVTVGIRGKTNNVSTNDKGEFALIANPETDALVFSYVGYVRQVIALAGKTNINVSFVEDSQSLDNEAVVVIGYGTKKKSEILGAVATISGAELQDIPAPNLAGALRNRIAGVGVSQSSGRPGSPITLNIRNSTTTTAAAGTTDEPLYVVDNITVTREAFDNIDASMIENLTFLKDASAAIYGAAGAKGVVLVTTKKGRIGRPSITYNGYVGVSDAIKVPKMLSGYEHALLLNDTFRSQGAAASEYFAPEDLEYIKTLDYKSWYDEVWQAATTQRHNIGISGGSDKITFFAGGSYQGENGNYAGMKFNKYSFRSGVVATLANGLKADVNFNVDYGTKELHHNAQDNDAPFFERLITVPRWVPISIDGKFVNYNVNGVNTSNINPLAVAESGYYNNGSNKSYRINAALTYEPTFLKGLVIKGQVSQSSGSSKNTQYIPPFTLYNFAKRGNNLELFTNQSPVGTAATFQPTSAANSSYTPGLIDNNSYQFFLTLQYAKTIAKHSFSLLAGAEQSEGNSQNSTVRYTNQLIPGVDQYFAYDINTLVASNLDKTAVSKRSGFARFSYDFDKKYLIEGPGGTEGGILGGMLHNAAKIVTNPIDARRTQRFQRGDRTGGSGPGRGRTPIVDRHAGCPPVGRRCQAGFRPSPLGYYQGRPVARKLRKAIPLAP